MNNATYKSPLIVYLEPIKTVAENVEEFRSALKKAYSLGKRLNLYKRYANGSEKEIVHIDRFVISIIRKCPELHDEILSSAIDMGSTILFRRLGNAENLIPGL